MDLCIECGIRPRSTAYSLTGSEMCDLCIAAELTAFQYHSRRTPMQLSEHGCKRIELIPEQGSTARWIEVRLYDEKDFCYSRLAIFGANGKYPDIVVCDEPHEPIEVKAIHEEAAA
jgi:hypothetical protein